MGGGGLSGGLEPRGPTDWRRRQEDVAAGEPRDHTGPGRFLPPRRSESLSHFTFARRSDTALSWEAEKGSVASSRSGAFPGSLWNGSLLGKLLQGRMR